MSSFCPRVSQHALRLSLPLFLLGAATAQWRPVPVSTTLPPVQFPSLTPLPSGELFFFGGTAPSDWTWSGTEWLATTTPIPRRTHHAIAADPATGEVVLYGGVDGSGTQLFDTWRRDPALGIWTQLTTASTPPAFSEEHAAFDPLSGDLLLVGRSSLGFETWRLGNDWAPVATAPPFGATKVLLHTDPIRGVAGMFRHLGGAVEVREFDGNTGDWVSRGSTTTFVTNLAAATFDERRGRAVHYAGLLNLGGVVEYDGLTIAPVPNSALQPLVTIRGMGFDRRRGEVLLVTNTGQLYSWAPEPAPFATPYGSPCNRPTARLALGVGDVPTLGATHRLTAPGFPPDLAVAVIGFSHVSDNGPLPRPLPASTCLQRVQNRIAMLLLGDPATLPITVPNLPALLGTRYDAQFIYLDSTGITDATNGLEVQIGLPPVQHVLTESFNNGVARDPQASGDIWVGGVATPSQIGGDGRHGSFDPSFGTPTGANTWVWDTDDTTIPASNTPSGNPYTVTDGRFYFTDFMLPAGVTIDFVGAAPAQIFVRGRVEIDGTLRLNGEAMTAFNARGVTTADAPYIDGQPGGRPGAGGGAGGRGGYECQGAGPIVVNGEILTNGADGEDVQVAAGHAYAAMAVGTGGAGSEMNPPSGPFSGEIGTSPPRVGFLYRAYYSFGGGGGGFSGPGGVAAITQTLTNVQLGTLPLGGSAFNLFPVPVGASSLEHFTVGGAGGGGGASQSFSTRWVSGDHYCAGAGGSGGGGAGVLRAGGLMTVLTNGRLEAKGGDGAILSGRNPATSASNPDWGIASPGGGGSGGSWLLQSANSVFFVGAVDTSGGPGSRNANVTAANLGPFQAHAGAGAPGFYRVESSGNIVFAGTGVPAYSPATNRGPLNDVDMQSGSRSLWLRPATADLPIYERYELVADVNGATVVFSDDPAVSNVAADDPNGPVYLRFQGAQIDPLSGQPDPATAGPWRTHVVPGPATLNSDRAQALRFDLVLDKSFGTVRVRELRVVWR
ncbi:MAG: hypothetical protein KDE27_32455 [Planctomycetes bacterium]|nr:hypothetical protein [Planctomycetota bacterium]